MRISSFLLNDMKTFLSRLNDSGEVTYFGISLCNITADGRNNSRFFQI